MKKIKTCAIVLATYNGEKYIGEQLNSIIYQTRTPDFLVITDDGSNDKTIKICENILSHSGLEFVIKVNKHSLGPAENFKKATKETTQDIVFFADQDDIWNYKKIESFMEVFETHDDCVEVLSDAYIWREGKTEGKLLDIWRDGYPQYTKEGCFEKNSFWQIAIKKNIATGMSMAVDRRILDIDYGSLLMLHDSWFNLVAGAKGNIYIINKPLANYRQHDANTVGIKSSLSIAAMKRAIGRVDLSLAQGKERKEVILRLNEKYHFLDQNNLNVLKEVNRFLEQRSNYIHNHNVIGIIILALKNKKNYLSKWFILRDIYVAIFYINKKG